MYVLKLNDETGQTQKWWTNFLYSLRTDTINNEYNLEAEFAKWGAEIMREVTPYVDSILFKNEEDRTWFLLHWS